YPDIEQIVRKPSGRLIVYYFSGDTPMADIIDPATGAKVGDYVPNGFRSWLTSFHRAFLLGDKARMIAGVGAGLMFLLTLTGIWMLARRMGGLRRIFSRARGTTSQRLHVEISRVVVFGLVLSSFTAVYLSLTSFEIVSDGSANSPGFPSEVNGGEPMATGDIPALAQVPVNRLRDLTFPYAGDLYDVYTLTTMEGAGFIDQSTGEMLSFAPNNMAQTAYEWVYMLHTGRGLWWLGLILGLAAMGAPVLAVTGTIIWWKNRRAAPKIRNNARAQSADTIILVGSQGNSTWGFAKTLHDGLNAAGMRVHTAPMNRLAPAYRKAERMFILTATYGDGEAPESAKSFLRRLEAVTGAPDYPVAVLGFGDRQFPQFCRFAGDVSESLGQRGWREMLPLERIDRQSAQEFARWSRDVGKAIGRDLDLVHKPARRQTQSLALLSRSDYGAEVQAPTSILRFALPGRNLWQRITGRGLPGFAAGDLVGILPPKSDLPRFYSLASASTEGFLEICVRKQSGGLCSGFLHGLKPGDCIDAFIQPNPDFRPARGHAPVILIGAGTGIGPLAGFIRANKRKRPMHLYFGTRDPKSDYLYEPEIGGWLDEKRLHSIDTAFSRTANKAYVQDRIRSDAENLQRLIRQGAQVMICGGREMAASVADALQAVLAPMEMDVARLRADGRYVEDVY
ncbi:MAG: PepSY domain-containing protein, partial [Paracoccaceae bacterium]